MSYLDSKPIVMFDMDGTLLDLAFDDLIWNNKLPQRHASTHQCTLEQSHDILRNFYQEHKHTLSWYSSKYWTSKVGVDVLQLQYDHQDLIKARPGCFELLEQLKQHGYRCWLVTNADLASLKLKLQNVAIADYFEVMVSSEQMQYAKEDQGFWQTLQQQHAFDPAHAILIDDTAPVLASAERFGIKHLLTILQPSSQKAARDATTLDYLALYNLTEVMDLLSNTPYNIRLGHHTASHRHEDIDVETT